MEHRKSSPCTREMRTRPRPDRKRSNSLPIVEALGCSTSEAQLMLAEGKAAVHSRRRNHRIRSVHDEAITVFNPRDHMKYLEGFARSEDVQEEASPSEATRSRHLRVLSDATDGSGETVVATPTDGDLSIKSSSVNPVGHYSANLAMFIKAQLKSIPTYNATHESVSPVSFWSCPDFSFQQYSPPQSPTTTTRKPIEAPRVIEIPAVQPPMQSAFSAWSSTDDEDEDEYEGEDEVLHLPDVEPFSLDAPSGTSTNSTPSILGYYESSSNRSFLFTSTPMLELDEPDMAKGFTSSDISARRDSSAEPHSLPHNDGNDRYPSAHSSHLRLTSSSSRPSFTSTASDSSYFDYKQYPISIAKERIIAALTPPQHRGKVLTTMSPFEGAALTNMHNVFVETQHRVQVDGMSFDMLRDFDFAFHSRVTTPC